ncbi:hypothetical protein ACA910_000915 [Epithemia clementina (nom. ined.)]
MFGLLYQQIHSRRPIVSDHKVRHAEQYSGSKDDSDNDNVDEENENEDEEVEKNSEGLQVKHSRESESEEEAQQDDGGNGENENNATNPTSVKDSSNAPNLERSNVSRITKLL